MALTRPKYSQIYDTDWKQSVELATTADVGNLVLANVQPNSIDGVTVQTNYRILVKDQNSGAQNGIYLVRDAGSGSNGWWSRSLDALTSDRVTAGMAVNVISGSINGGKEFKLTTPDPITLGTTVLTFIDPNAAAGAGGANTQVQFNDASILGGSAGFTFNKFSNVLTMSGLVVGQSAYVGELFVRSTGGDEGGQLNLGPAVTNTTLVGNVTIDVYQNRLRIFEGGGTNRGGYYDIGNLSAGVGTNLIGGGGGTNFSNVNVAAYTQTMGYTNYSNVNVAAYSQTMGFSNYSNVNVSAVITTNGLTNYSNVNVAAYTRTQSYTNYSNVNLSAYLGGAVTIGGNLTINGNLFINGNATTINSNNLTVNDSMIYLADENPGDTLDIGITAHVVNPTLNHIGFVRDATDLTWKLFSNVAAQPTNTVDFTGANYANILVGNITATYFTGNGAFLTGLASSYSNVQVATYLPTYSGNIANLRITSGTTSTSTTTGALIVTGGVGVGGNLFVGGALTESSSATLKENITPIDGALDLILQLTGVIYDRRDGSRKNEAGLIAEEVNKVLPNLITLDDQGTPLGVQYTKLTAYLIEAVKSLKAEIDQLKKRD
jgi:hypothetical protein